MADLHAMIAQLMSTEDLYERDMLRYYLHRRLERLDRDARRYRRIPRDVLRQLAA